MNILYDMLPHGRDGNQPDRIIVHSMGEFIESNDLVYSARDWLNHLGLSAHALVKPDGDIIVCRDDSQVGWHAKGHNTNTLGIEFLVSGLHTYDTWKKAIKEDVWTPRQYLVGAQFIMGWKRKFNIKSMERHSDIDPDRKVDPGDGFQWDYLVEKTRHV